MEQIFFVQSGKSGPIKIGRSADPDLRLADLRAASPDELTLLAAVPGNLETERALRTQFAADHTRGGWFKPSKALKSYIQGLKQKPLKEPQEAGTAIVKVVGGRRDALVRKMAGTSLAKPFDGATDRFAAAVAAFWGELESEHSRRAYKNDWRLFCLWLEQVHVQPEDVKVHRQSRQQNSHRHIPGCSC